LIFDGINYSVLPCCGYTIKNDKKYGTKVNFSVTGFPENAPTLSSTSYLLSNGYNKFFYSTSIKSVPSMTFGYPIMIKIKCLTASHVLINKAHVTTIWLLDLHWFMHSRLYLTHHQNSKSYHQQVGMVNTEIPPTQVKKSEGNNSKSCFRA